LAKSLERCYNTLGIEAIPQDWREKLENREHIEDLALKLVETKQEKYR